MGGRGFPLGRRVVGCRSSSKYGWTQASSGARRRVGVYSNSCPTRSIASDDVRGLNTYKGKCKTLGSKCSMNLTVAFNKHRKLILPAAFTSGSRFFAANQHIMSHKC